MEQETNISHVRRLLKDLLKFADDVCLLLTFAARHRVMVLGYDYVTQYRRFQQFRSPLELFKQAFVAFDTVCWPGDMDIAPKNLHDCSILSKKHQCSLVTKLLHGNVRERRI